MECLRNGIIPQTNLDKIAKVAKVQSQLFTAGFDPRCDKDFLRVYSQLFIQLESYHFVDVFF